MDGALRHLAMGTFDAGLFPLNGLQRGVAAIAKPRGR